MWSSWVKENGTTQVMYIAKLKDGPKRIKKILSMIWKRFLKWYDGGDGGMESYKKIFEVEVFFSSQNIDLPFYLKRLLELSLFFNTFSSSFSLFFFFAPSLEDLGFLMILEEKNHFFNNFFSNEMVWTG
jgi:hypothetical protein